MNKKNFIVLLGGIILFIIGLMLIIFHNNKYKNYIKYDSKIFHIETYYDEITYYDSDYLIHESHEKVKKYDFYLEYNSERIGVITKSYNPFYKVGSKITVYKTNNNNDDNVIVYKIPYLYIYMILLGILFILCCIHCYILKININRYFDLQITLIVTLFSSIVYLIFQIFDINITGLFVLFLITFINIAYIMTILSDIIKHYLKIKIKEL